MSLSVSRGSRNSNARMPHASEALVSEQPEFERESDDDSRINRSVDGASEP